MINLLFVTVPSVEGGELLIVPTQITHVKQVNKAKRATIYFVGGVEIDVPLTPQEFVQHVGAKLSGKGA